MKKPVLLENTVFYVRKNSIYLEWEYIFISLNYDRIIPLSNKLGLSLRLGVMGSKILNKIRILGESTLLIGGLKHFFDPGIGIMYNERFLKFIRIGYRFQGSNGILFRFAPILVRGAPFFGISIGYSF